MRLTAVLVTALALTSGCGDNTEGPLVEEVCAPTPPSPPVEGPFLDPLALPLPAGCVEGGLRDLPGRWFVVDPTVGFSFSYPKFEGSCTTGFRRANWIDDDLELGEDDSTFHTWSDGTRFYTRSYYKFDFGGDAPFEFATATAACLLADGTMAAVEADFDTDRGERFAMMEGTRFAPRDTGGEGLALVGALGLTPDSVPIIGYNVAIDGDLAVVAGPLGLDVIDISEPTTPVHVRHIDGRFNDVKLARGASALVAYAAPIGNETTAIVDLTTPSMASVVGQIPAYSHSLFITPTTPPKLYLANYTGMVPVFDITNPLIPVRLGNVGVPGDSEVGIHDIHVAGDRIYANKTTEGVVALDVSAGIADAVDLGRLDSAYSHASWAGTAGGRQILIHGDEGMTPDGGALLKILDVDAASPTFMQEIGRFRTRAEVGIHNILLVDDKAYIAYYQDGIRVVDLADPTAPREVGRYNTWDPETASGQAFEGAIGLAVIGDLVYVADSDRGLVILRDTTP